MAAPLSMRRRPASPSTSEPSRGTRSGTGSSHYRPSLRSIFLRTGKSSRGSLVCGTPTA
jgi:hypothetical protein